jgi:hypothetical protein
MVSAFEFKGIIAGRRHNSGTDLFILLFLFGQVSPFACRSRRRAISASLSCFFLRDDSAGGMDIRSETIVDAKYIHKDT